MPEVQRVTIQIRAPSGDDPGQVSEGYFIVENGQVIMTDASGAEVMPGQFRHTLGPGENPRSIAGRKVREVRRALSGRSEVEEQFAKPLAYPRVGVT